MKNTNIATVVLGSCVVYILSALVYSMTDDSVVLLVSLISFAVYSVFSIWGLVKLFKSHE